LHFFQELVLGQKITKQVIADNLQCSQGNCEKKSRNLLLEEELCSEGNHSSTGSKDQ